MACGESHSVAVTQDAHVFTWGRGKYGALGHNDTANQTRPQLVEDLFSVQVTSVACGADHTLALTGHGTLFSVSNSVAVCPDFCVFCFMFWHVACLALQASLLDCLLLANAAVLMFCLAGMSCGRKWQWGRGLWGQTGHGTTDDLASPQQVQGLAGKYVTQVAAGKRHSLAVVGGEKVYGWGDGEHWQLGEPAR